MCAQNSKPLPKYEVRVRNYTVGGPVNNDRGDPVKPADTATQRREESPGYVNGPGGHMATFRDRKA